MSQEKGTKKRLDKEARFACLTFRNASRYLRKQFMHFNKIVSVLSPDHYTL